MSVKVAIRVRPFNERQKFLGCICCVEMKDSTTVLYQNKEKSKKQHYFTFDYSFWSHDEFKVREDGLMVPTSNKYVDQQIVYDQIGHSILDNAWEGYNCCLFAYGQTGAGKSYSMIGYGVNRGIIPMVCDELFQKIRKLERKGQKQFQITFAMIQIYNEKVQDLFTSTNKRPPNGLKIRENKTLGVYVEGMSKHPVSSYAEIERKMDEGSKNRSLASTLMNEYSSRAHTIIMLEFIQKQWVTDKKMNKKSSLINLVDLAGSERVAKTGISDNKDRLKEASNINKSLHTLGRVIETLAEIGAGRGKNLQVPYRESSLTRILQGALGGNSKTTMICAISPANDNYEQTLSTLRYADQTKKIKNKPIVNQNAVDKLIRQLRQENQRLKLMLQTNEYTSLSNNKEIMTQSQKKEMKINVKASMRQIQKQIRKNMQSFAISPTAEDDEEESLLISEFVDLDQPSFNYSELSFDFGNKAQVYITNLNEDELLNFKIRYSCENDLLITNKSKSKTKQNDGLSKIVLCGLGIEENHAKIFKKGDKYFIQALSETSAEYTLVNGKPVYQKKELNNNDRIILGTNSVFLFKNNQSKKDEASSSKHLDYEFAVNERQMQMQNMSLINPSALGLFSPGTLSKLSQNSQMSQIYQMNQFSSTKRLFQSQIDGEMVKKLEDIEKQFTDMVKENQKKTKAKEEEYKNKLLLLKKQKEREREERELLEKKLVIKSIQTEKLRDKQYEIEKLKKKLAKYNQEKEKRIKHRQSMLIEGDDYGSPNRASFNEEQLIDFVDLQPPRKLSKLSEIYADIVEQEIDDNQMDENLLDDEVPKIKNNTEGINIVSIRQPLQKSYEYIPKRNFQIVQSVDEMLKCRAKRTLLFERLYNIKILNDKQISAICRFCKQGIQAQIQKQADNSKSNLMTTSDIQYKDWQIHNQQDNQLEKYLENIKVEKDASLALELQESEYKDLIQNYSQDNKESLNGLADRNSQNHSKLTQGQLSQNQLELRLSQKEQEGKLYQQMHSELKSKLDQILRTQKKKKVYGISATEFIHVESCIENNQKVKPPGQKLPSRQKLPPRYKHSLMNPCDFQQNFENDEEDDLDEVEKYLNRPQLEHKTLNMISKVNQHLVQSTKKIASDQFIDTQQTPVFKSNKNVRDAQDYQEKELIQRDAQKTQLISQIKIDKEHIHIVENNQIDPEGIQITISPIKQKSVNERQLEVDELLPKQINLEKKQFSLEEKQEIEKSQQSLEIKGSKSVESIDKEIQSSQQHHSGDDGKKNSSYLGIEPVKARQENQFGLNLSVSDIQKNDFSYQQMSYMNFDGLLKEEDLNLKIRQLESKIKQLEQGNNASPDKQAKSEQNISRSNTEEIKDQDPALMKESKDSTTRKRSDTGFVNKPKKSKRKKSQLTEDQRRQIQIQRQLQLKIVQCNNQNIINDRNIQLYKRKREIDELRKLLFKKQKIQLQKQLLILIPMIRRFNLIAKEMNRLIQARISIQYRNFTHYQMIQALKNYSINKKINGNNIGIGITIANQEEGRLYRWNMQIFKNRFEIAEQVFQKYLENGEATNISHARYFQSAQDKSKDPFWDPIDFSQQGLAYLSLEFLLYDLPFQGYVSFVWKGGVVAKAYVTLVPVKVKQNRNDDDSEDFSESESRAGVQIFNQRNLLEKDLYFNLCIESITFTQKPDLHKAHGTPPSTPSNDAANSTILKYYISYTLLEHDYSYATYTTPQMDFIANKQFKEIGYLRRHRFDEISESTLAYLADCPIKFGLHVMKDYNEQCLEGSFCEYDEDGSLVDTSMTHSNGDDIKTVSNMSLNNLITASPDSSPTNKKPNFSKKEKTAIFYENTQIIGKIEQECKKEEQKAKQKAKLRAKQERRGQLKADDKNKDKDCTIY